MSKTQTNSRHIFVLTGKKPITTPTPSFANFYNSRSNRANALFASLCKMYIQRKLYGIFYSLYAFSYLKRRWTGADAGAGVGAGAGTGAGAGADCTTTFSKMIG